MKMEQQILLGIGKVAEGPEKVSHTSQPDRVEDFPRYVTSKWVKQDPEGGQTKERERQWQEFLKALDYPPSEWETPPTKDPGPWDDAKAFLASFEQVAKACQWPREEWVVRLLPALSGEAEQAFGILDVKDRGNYGKVKAAILRGNTLQMESQRQHFRQFRYRDADDPRRVYSQLRELCHRWLKPERHTKEQILELLILEQFLAILPPEIQNWVRECGPENCIQTASLVEEFLMSQQETDMWKWQQMVEMVIRVNTINMGLKTIFQPIGLTPLILMDFFVGNWKGTILHKLSLCGFSWPIIQTMGYEKVKAAIHHRLLDIEMQEAVFRIPKGVI